MPVKERIKEFIKSQHISERQFCKKIGVSSAYISSMRVSIQPDKLESIALHYPELNTTWLITGKGKMLNNYPEQTINDQTLHEESVPLRSNSMEGLIEICLNLQKDNNFLKAQLERKDNSLDDLNFKLERRIAEVESKNLEIEALKTDIRQLDDDIKIRDAIIRGKDTIIESSLDTDDSVILKGEKAG